VAEGAAGVEAKAGAEAVEAAEGVPVAVAAVVAAAAATTGPAICPRTIPCGAGWGRTRPEVEAQAEAAVEEVTTAKIEAAKHFL